MKAPATWAIKPSIQSNISIPAMSNSMASHCLRYGHNYMLQED
jgi:hypothetical protein